ncbi:MAG: hypothetical protein Q4P29_04895 [Tissierellia bacterium]|nr:hypothetical protein [Tissierellia bacterium]
MKNKFISIFAALILVISMTACQNKEKVSENDTQIEETKLDSQTEETKEEAKETEEAPAKENMTEEEIIKQRLDNSDYLAKIKLISKGPKGKEIKVLDSIKGILPHDKIQDLEGLTENRAYLVFMKEEDGNIVFTDDESLILLEGDQDKLFETINKEIHK